MSCARGLLLPCGVREAYQGCSGRVHGAVSWCSKLPAAALLSGRVGRSATRCCGIVVALWHQPGLPVPLPCGVAAVTAGVTRGCSSPGRGVMPWSLRLLVVAQLSGRVGRRPMRCVSSPAALWYPSCHCQGDQGCNGRVRGVVLWCSKLPAILQLSGRVGGCIIWRAGGAHTGIKCACEL